MRRGTLKGIRFGVLRVLGGCLLSLGLGCQAPPEDEEPPVCGDGSRDGDEQCDAHDLGDWTCEAAGFANGELSCTASCTFDTSGCLSLSTLRMDGGLATGSSTFDGRVFVPLLDYLTAGEALDSQGGLTDGIPIANTDHDELYQRETWVPLSQSATFEFPVVQGSYSVHLHFVDWHPSATLEPGDRLFHVDLQGERVLEDLDVIAEVGKDAALVQSFDVDASSGAIELVLTSHVLWAQIAAVEVVPSGEPHLPTTGCADPPCDVEPECGEGEITSACDCGGTIATSGYCCSGALRTTPCSTPVCDEGEVLRGCTCGGDVVSTGYCCLGSHQTSACSFTVYYVSNSGDDANAGTSSSAPWQTLSKVSATSLSPGDAVLFKRGDEWVGTVTVTSSGTSGSPITYGAYGAGASPKIYGSEEITGWTRHSGSIYKASFGGSINQLFVDGERMRAARYPDSGYFPISSVETSTSFTADDLDSSIDYAGARWFGRTYYFTADLREVTSSSSKTLTLGAPTRKGLGVGQGFFLMNRLEFLTQPGEWYYDEDDDLVYLWTPDGSTPESHEVRGSTTETGVYLASKDHVVVRDLHLLHQAKQGLYWSASDNVRVQNVEFTYPDGFGIFTPNNSAYAEISNNDVVGANHYGMMIRVSHSTITDNRISKIALFENIGLTGTGEDNYGGGVYLAGEEGDNVFRYNRIIETGYSGLLFARPGNIIEYNFIKDTVLLKSDMGGIYTSWYERTAPTGPEGSVIRYNIVLNAFGETSGYTSNRYLGQCIYIDESARGVVVEHNTVAHCSDSGVFLHQNEDATVRHNTIFDSGAAFQQVGTSGTVENEIYGNLMVAGRGEHNYGYLERQVLVWTNTRDLVLDDNRYVHPFATEGVFRQCSDYWSFEDWRSVTGEDASSVFDGTPAGAGETIQLFYNDTRSDRTWSVDGAVVRDVDGGPLTGSFTLAPFTSVILMGEDLHLIRAL